MNKQVFKGERLISVIDVGDGFIPVYITVRDLLMFANRLCNGFALLKFGIFLPMLLSFVAVSLG